MRFAIAIAVVALLAPAAFADNAVVPVEQDPRIEVHGGASDMSILVYTDDYLYRDYVISALNQLGYGYTAYYSNPSGFEAAVASGAYDLVITNHENYFEVSNSWDDIYNHLLAGKAAIVHTFDWDGSHDYSGYSDELLGLGGHTYYADVQDAMNVQVWNADPIYTGAGDPIVVVAGGAYYDEGDKLTGTGESGFTDYVDPNEVNCNIYCGDYALVIFAYCMDEYDGTQIIQIWKNAINWIYWGASATDETSWGGVKAMFK